MSPARRPAAEAYTAQVNNLFGGPVPPPGWHVATWKATMAYALTMSEARGQRYRVAGSKYPDGEWRYGAYPTARPARRPVEHLEPTA